MYQCQKCGSALSGEAQAEITSVMNSLSPGQAPYGLLDYIEQRYPCKACRSTGSAARQAPAGSKPTKT